MKTMFNYGSELPLVSMTLSQIMGNLFGMEWYLCCEMYEMSGRGTEEWLTTCKVIVEAIRSRLYFLFSQSSVPSDVLDISEYVEEVIEEKQEEPIPIDYFSDEEGKKQNKRMKKTLTLDNLFDDDDDDTSAGTTSLKITKRKLTMDFVHDVNWTLRQIDLALSMVVIQPHTDYHVPGIGMFRHRRKEQLIRFSELIPRRRLWQYNYQCLPSHRAIYIRRTKRIKASVSEIMANKLHQLLNENMPENMEQMLGYPVHISPEIWLRVNTDFLFELASSMNEEGDVVSYLIHNGIIVRIRALGKWRYNNRYFDSFTHAFAYMREIEQHKDPKVVIFNQDILPVTIDLSIFDSEILNQ